MAHTLSRRDLDFLLYEVHDAASLLAYPQFADHAKETFDAYVGVCRRFARETLFPAYRVLDAEPPSFAHGRVTVHPLLHMLWPKLVEIGVAKGRSTKPGLKTGVCGEHGGDPSSVQFFHDTGLDYVSCSQFRVPTARLAAGQAAIRAEAESGVVSDVGMVLGA